MPGTRGVYFVANDHVAELVTAFLNSFRLTNPDIPLRLIPFDSDYGRIAALADRYGFTVWADGAALARYDEISLSFHPRTKGHFRKLAAWEGEFDEFLYIDSDTAVLRNIDFVFGHLADYGFVTATSHLPGRAWKETVRDSGLLTEEQYGYRANTGFVASRRGALTPAGIQAALPGARELAPHMKLGYEQPFLNYLMVTSGLPYTSLHRLRTTTGDPAVPAEIFAWTPGVKAKDGAIVHPVVPPPLLVHWTEPVKPGQADPADIPLYDLWCHYRDLHTRT
ncbi:hypothetical protein [Streptomyces clavuligerus]|uniref:Uncharacterized protein n=1 Tax=Streptomyces clavuligerus TaxID=1901 RepID=E2PZC2_STRCL|nr:hypothetical protein [Streptomyces clavuligerus]ANW17161.1 hypothetical protein BB341_02470 [Streptomyces clavuligerus]AXU11701.1 hypothetical protein D1794_02570 [Streptomyces clavuligerus]EFG10383.1 Hypothetical protein SCLAV_5316 [Streptomyces clavuligerus]MBY6301541.1 hypothetical protein [Streptomyces clavuligerus]QCS04481.1 hypothetical protein CRV15_02005 [Streptomyces clavuligerus]